MGGEKNGSKLKFSWCLFIALQKNTPHLHSEVQFSLWAYLERLTFSSDAVLLFFRNIIVQCFTIEKMIKTIQLYCCMNKNILNCTHFKLQHFSVLIF